MSDTPKQDDDFVLTPGGMRPRELVQHVASGETVTTTPEGRMVTVPGTEAAYAHAQGLGPTPGGWRPRSLSITFRIGHVVDGVGGHLRITTQQVYPDQDHWANGTARNRRAANASQRNACTTPCCRPRQRMDRIRSWARSGSSVTSFVSK